MKKKKVTVKTGKFFWNTKSAQVTIAKEFRQHAKIRRGDPAVSFQYQGPTIDLGIFTIRDGDVVIRKGEPVTTV